LLGRAQSCPPFNLAIAVLIAKTVKSGPRIIAKPPARFIMNRDFILTGLCLQSAWERCRGDIKHIKSLRVKWDQITGDIYVLYVSWTCIGKASFANDAMIKV
jgi:hypothetical protein